MLQLKMSIKRLVLLGSVMSVTAMSAGCGSDPASAPPPVLEEGEIAVDDRCDIDDADQNCIEVADGVVTLDDLPGLEGIGFDVDRQAALLTFSPGSTRPAALQEGAVIYKRRGARKFVRRIVSVSETATGYEIVTERVPIRDAIKRMRLVGDFALDLDRGVAIPVETAALSRSAGIAQEWAGLKRSRSGSKVILETPRVNATLDYEWSYDVFVRVRALFGLGKNDESEVTLNGEFEAFLGASVSISDAFDRKAELILLNFPPVPIGLVTVDIDVFGGVNLAGSGSLEASVGYRGTVDIAAGFQTAPRGGIAATFFDEDPKLTREGPEITGEGLISGRVYLEPEIGIGWDPLVEGTVGAEIYAKVDLSGYTVSSEVLGDDVRAKREFCTDLSIGVAPELGISGLFNLLDEEWQLATFDVSLPGFPTCEIRTEVEFGAVSRCNIAADAEEMPAGICLQDADCVKETTHPCEVVTCNSNCVCETVDRAQEDCCIPDAWREAHPGPIFRPGFEYDCDDDDPRTIDSCIDTQCRHEWIPNSCLDVNDCIDFDDGGDSEAICIRERALDAEVSQAPTRERLPSQIIGEGEDAIGFCSYVIVYSLPEEPEEGPTAPVVVDECDIRTEDVDCDDGDDGTRDWCLKEPATPGGPVSPATPGECRNTPRRLQPGACIRDGQCDDGDVQTGDSCEEGRCVYTRVSEHTRPPGL